MGLTDDILRAQSDQAAIEIARKQYRDKQNPYSFGGSVDAYQNAIKGYRDQAVAPMADPRITADPSMYNADRGLIGQSQGIQGAGLDYWQGMAAGTGPSAATDAYRQSQAATANAMQSTANSARGGAQNQVAARRFAQSGVGMGTQADLDAIRAQEQMQGAQGYMNAAGTQRMGYQGAQGLSANWANEIANQGIKQQQQDLGYQRGMTGLAHKTNLDQQSGATAGLRTEMGQTAASLALEAEKRAREGRMTGAIVQDVAKVGGAGIDAYSDYAQKEEDDAKRKWGF